MNLLPLWVTYALNIKKLMLSRPLLVAVKQRIDIAVLLDRTRQAGQNKRVSIDVEFRNVKQIISTN
jgi:hypothetical protein